MAATSASRLWRCAVTTARTPRAGRPLAGTTGPRCCPRAPGPALTAAQRGARGSAGSRRQLAAAMPASGARGSITRQARHRVSPAFRQAWSGLRTLFRPAGGRSGCSPETPLQRSAGPSALHGRPRTGLAGGVFRLDVRGCVEPASPASASGHAIFRGRRPGKAGEPEGRFGIVNELIGARDRRVIRSRG
jgi:hypothetical protein